MATHPCLYSVSRMNIDSVATFLEDQSKLYQSHCSKKERIQNVLNFQHNIRNYKTIPKQYMPSNFPEIPTGNPSLSIDFHQEYSTLFFEYLDKVITHNVISQELEESQLRNIISHTEKVLATAEVPPETTSQLYRKFVSENNIPLHRIEPALQLLLNENPFPSFTQTPDPPPKETPKNRKRKRSYKKKKKKRQKLNQEKVTSIKPKCRSRPRDQHFLVKRLVHNNPLS